MGNLIDEIPGYKEAIASEGFNRDAAFLDLSETVGGVELRSMTLLDFLRIDVVKSPFLYGGIPDVTDIGVFLWALSPGYNPTDTIARTAFLKSIRKFRYSELVPAIEKYLEETFADSPANQGVGGIPTVSWLACTVDLIAAEYHWTESVILNLPLKRLFQYQRRILKRHNPKATLFNGSDRVRGRWLEELNRDKN